MQTPRDQALGQRLHGMSPVFQIGSSFLTMVVPGLLFFVFAAGDSYAAWYMIAFLPAVSISLVRYFTLRYDLTEDHIVVREGFVFRSVRHIPFLRIQNIDTIQNPLHRLFGVAEVRLETAGGREPEAVFRVLSLDSLASIRRGVFAGRNAQGEQVEAVVGSHEGSPFFSMGKADIAIFGLLSQRGMALLVGLIFLVWEFDLWPKLKGVLPFDPEEASRSASFLTWIGAGVGLFVILQWLTVAWAFLTLHGFQITRNQDGLSTVCGLWVRQSATLPRHRIHFLSVREGPMPRCLGRLSIQAVTAGGEMEKEEQLSRKWLIPLTHKRNLKALLSEVQPGLDFDELPWTPVHGRAFSRMFKRWLVLSLAPCVALALRFPWLGGGAYACIALLGVWAFRHRARRLGYTLSKQAILVRDGILTHERNAVRFSKIQSISIRQSPFDRRHAMASLEVDTAGQRSQGPRLRIPYLDLQVAEELKDRLSALASGASFQW